MIQETYVSILLIYHCMLSYGPLALTTYYFGPLALATYDMLLYYRIRPLDVLPMLRLAVLAC